MSWLVLVAKLPGNTPMPRKLYIFTNPEHGEQSRKKHVASLHAFKFCAMEFSFLSQRVSQSKHCNNHRTKRELILSVFLSVGKVIFVITSDWWLYWLLFLLPSKAIQSASQGRWVWLTLESCKIKFVRFFNRVYFLAYMYVWVYIFI